MLHSSLLPFHPCWLESSEEKRCPAEQFQDDSGSTQSPAAARLSSGEQFLGAVSGQCLGFHRIVSSPSWQSPGTIPGLQTWSGAQEGCREG